MTDWRRHLLEVHGIKVHPEAEHWPLLRPGELARLGEDILAHGLRQPIVFYTDANGAKWLIDGRNRLEALQAVLPNAEHARHYTEILDPDDPLHPPTLKRYVNSARWVNDREVKGDVAAYIDSCNLHRRHLKPKDVQRRIDALLKTSHQRSDRALAREAGVDHKTMASARAKAVARGEIPTSDIRIDAKGRHQPATKGLARFPRKHDMVTTTPHAERAPAPARSLEDQLNVVLMGDRTASIEQLARQIEFAHPDSLHLRPETIASSISRLDAEIRARESLKHALVSRLPAEARSRITEPDKPAAQASTASVV